MAALGPVRASGAEPGIGQLIREWRQRRRLSQMDLALNTGISARHLSFLETGRSKPSAEMVVRLAEQMEIPFRDRNRMLLAAGFAPAYRELEMAEPEMEPVRAALQRVLDGHEPYPAVVVDGGWNMVAANSAIGGLTAGSDPELLEPPVNVLELTLDPRGMAPRILNFAEWRAHLLERLARQVALSGSAELEALLDRLVAAARRRGLDPAADRRLPDRLRARARARVPAGAALADSGPGRDRRQRDLDGRQPDRARGGLARPEHRWRRLDRAAGSGRRRFRRPAGGGAEERATLSMAGPRPTHPTRRSARFGQQFPEMCGAFGA